MGTKIINKSQVKNALNIPGIAGSIVAAMAMRVAGFDKLNEMYSHVEDYQGIEFIDKLFEHLEINLDFNKDSLSSIPKEGSLLITSNHPFGGLDGMAALKVLSMVRSDIKVLTNMFVAHVPNIKDFFIPVNTTYGFGRIVRSNYAGLRQAEEHLNKGGALIVFPAGEVSANSVDNNIEDAEWQSTIIRIARKAQSQILPIFFAGGNSWYFQFLSKISVKLSDLRLPAELSNKKGKDVYLRIGSYINPVELSRFKDDKAVAKYLRSRSYALECEVNNVIQSEGEQVPLISPIATEDLLKDIEANKSDKLFTVGTYSAYLFDYEKIPNLIREIGLRREEAFRGVGEGTGKEIDLDQYDNYYKHLILWDDENKDMVGAYRIGLGREIIEKYGIEGFYSHTLFRYSPEFAPVLKESVELGRSFVSVSHQKDTMGLVLLLKGLFYVMIKYEEYKHLLGPVSISSWYPKFYRSVMIHYLRQFASAEEYKNMLNPLHPFKEEFGRVDIDSFLSGKTDNLEGFDRYLYRVSQGKYRLPTLVKKYIKLGAKIVDYNVDPDFNYCVDGLIILTLENVPTDDIDALSKEIEDHRPIYRRFYGNNY